MTISEITTKVNNLDITSKINEIIPVTNTVTNEIDTKEDIFKTANVLATSGTVALTDNSINSITPSAAVTFTLPEITDNTVFHQILVQVNLSTVYSITLGTSNFFNSTAPDMSNAGVYNLFYEYDKANQYWVVGAVVKGAES